MRLDPASHPDYLVGHIEDALTRDPRVSEQELRVHLEGEPARIVVTGTVASAGCRDAVLDVVTELVPGMDVRVDTTVRDYPESGEPEEVR